MPETTADSRVAGISQQQIASLASLYDRFANALDPFCDDCNTAEQAFMCDVATLYDYAVEDKSISHRDFLRAVIVRCKRHLKKN